MKQITIEELQKQYKEEYSEFSKQILAKIEKGIYKPVKASGTNGKKPALYNRYWVMEEKKDYSALLEELMFEMSPQIDITYYSSHLDKYAIDRQWVWMLNEFIIYQKHYLEEEVSLNERSFQIWKREKFLKQEGGKQILKRTGIRMEDLLIYETTEPLSYFSNSKETPQNILIIENKDTFYSMRKSLLNGHDRILGVRIGTLIYGAGNGIVRSFQDFNLCAEPYMKKKENQLLYFGDLDYEGILIYERLYHMFEQETRIAPFANGYLCMLQRAGDIEKLPDTKKGQKKNIEWIFLEHFSKEVQFRMSKILKLGKYIPQEVLCIQDFWQEDKYCGL
ncbi:MAG: Wadjet anti-phage system protein JetD domain-containing protein [Velocimicrobium sp.]